MTTKTLAATLRGYLLLFIGMMLLLTIPRTHLQLPESVQGRWTLLGFVILLGLAVWFRIRGRRRLETELDEEVRRLTDGAPDRHVRACRLESLKLLRRYERAQHGQRFGWRQTLTERRRAIIVSDIIGHPAVRDMITVARIAYVSKRAG